MKNNKDYEIGSGNVFADLGFPDAEERLAKAEIAYQINYIIEQKDLSQAQAAKLLEIDQPKVSALGKGKLAGFSLERLFRFLNILGQTITIKIEPKARSKKKAGVIVSFPKSIKKSIIKKEEQLNKRSVQAKKVK